MLSELGIIKKIVGLALIFLLFWIGVRGQANIHGVVGDTLGNPIPFTQILLKPEGENPIVAFAQSNGKGEYSLKISRWGNFMLEFKAISFQSQVYPITIIESEREHDIIINPILKHQSVSISEVVVMGERPITIKRDTIIFRVSAFARGDEQVAEDILKRLPGLTVSDNGAILWQGKEVEKLMVEGDDIFGKGYRLISRNLPSGVIDKVEVYERYSHNSLLKEIEYSDRVALNLSLRDDVRLTFFGNASVGYSSYHTHSVKGSAMSIGRKEKYYFFGNSNSIGINPTGDIKYFINPQMGDEQSPSLEKATSLNYIINLRGFTPNLKEQRVRNNNSNMLSISTIFKPSQKLTTKLITFGTYELDNYFNEGYQTYQLATSSFTNTESHNLSNRVMSGFGRVEIKYDHSSTINVEYQGQVINEMSKSNSEYIFNQSSSKELLNNSTTSTNHRVVITHRKSPSTAIVAFGQYFFDERPEKYYVSNFTLGELFPNVVGGVGQWQSVKSRMQMSRAEVKAIWRLGEKYVINAQSGGLLQSNNLLSTFTIDLNNGSMVTPVSAYGNNMCLLFSDSYIGSSITRMIKNVSFNATVDVHWIHSISKEFQNSPIAQSLPFIEPKLGGQWQLNRKNKIQALYIYNASPTSMLELMSGLVLVGPRSFQKGTGQFSLQRSHTSMLRYDFGRVTDILQIQVSALYSNSNRAFASDLQIAPSYVLQSLLLNNISKMLITSTSTDLFIRLIRSNLKLNAGFVSNDFNRSVNGSITKVTSQGFSYGGELRSAFKGIFNFHLGTNWSNTRFIATRVSNNINNYQFIDFHIKFSPSLHSTINAERYLFGNISNPDNPWYFIDGSLTYTHKPNNLSFTVLANNLLNNKVFGNITISEINETGSFFRIVPRYLMLRVDYRF